MDKAKNDTSNKNYTMIKNQFELKSKIEELSKPSHENKEKTISTKNVRHVNRLNNEANDSKPKLIRDLNLDDKSQDHIKSSKMVG